MKTISRTTAIPHVPDLLFALVMSPETAPLIDPAVREWSADARPIGVGTQFSIRGRLGILPIRGRSEVVTWNPPTCAEFRSLTPTWPFRMTASHLFEPDVGGGTRYTWSVTFHPVSIIATPAVALSARLFEPALERQAEALIRYARSVSSDPLPML